VPFTEDPERLSRAGRSRTVRGVATAAAAVLLAAGCGLLPGGGDGGSGGGKTGEDGAGGSAAGAGAGDMPRTIRPTTLGEDTGLEVASVERADNDTTVVKFSITNDRDEPVSIFNDLVHGYPDGLSVGGVSVIDVGRKKQYLPIRHGEQEHGRQPCYCSTFMEFEDETEIPPGETFDF